MTVADYPASTFKVSSDFSLLDRKWIVNQILAQYWGKFRDDKKIMRSMMHSMNFGLYESGPDRIEWTPPKQIGFARVVSDRATFSYICDVIIEPSYRGKGLGKFLMTEVLANEAVNGTVCLLRTRDQEFYTPFGFTHCDAMLRKPHGAA